jgi:microcystin degradation protein MlrC
VHKIVLIEIQQETNSFSPVASTLDDFKSFVLLYGDEIEPAARRTRFQLAGFYQAHDRYGRADVEPVPLVCAWATTSGPLTAETWAHFRKVVADGLAAHPDAAGVYLSLHGAMSVAGITDAEGDLLGAVRAQVGPEVVIGVSLDLHANLTRRLVEQATFVTSYRTNPHRDHVRVGYRTGKLLMDAVRGTVRPVMAYRKLRLLKGGGFTLDFLAPMRAIFRRMNRMERQPGVLSVSTFMVHLWMEDPELGWSTLVVTDGNQPLADQLADELAELNWAVRHHRHPMPLGLPEAIARLRKSRWRRWAGTAVLCDASDAVSAGAPGENTWVLRALAEEVPHLRAYVPIRDEAVALALYEQPIGTKVEVDVGGKLERRYNEPYRLRGTLVSKHLTRSLPAERRSKAVVIRQNQTYVIVTERAQAVFYPRFYTDMGLSLWKADVVVVKNLFPFRYFFLPYNRQTLNVVTPGTTHIDVTQVGVPGHSAPHFSTRRPRRLAVSKTGYRLAWNRYPVQYPKKGPSLSGARRRGCSGFYTG